MILSLSANNMITLLIKSSVRIIRKQITLSAVKITGLALGMATFLITSLYTLHEWSFDKQHPGWDRIYRYVHRVKSGDDLQSFAFTSATTGPALKERFPEVEDFTRILAIEVSLKNLDSDVGFIERSSPLPMEISSRCFPSPCGRDTITRFFVSRLM